MNPQSERQKMPETRLIRDVLLGALATPIVPPEATRILNDMSTDQCLHAAMRILRLAHLRNPRFNVQQDVIADNQLTLTITQPHHVPVTFRVIRRDAIHSRNIPEDAQVLLLAVDVSDGTVREMVSTYVATALSDDRTRVLVDPQWLASWLDDSVCQIALPKDAYARHPKEGRLGNEAEVSVRRARAQFAGIEGAVLPDPGSYAERLRQLEADPIHGGPVYLCSTFLPPVTFAGRAVLRFYGEVLKANKPLIDLVQDKIRLEREAWERHVSHYQRIDIIDRAMLEGYLRAPEYYQMMLTASELEEQISNICELLEMSNYQLCITDEAIDLAFEIRGDEIRIRTDRRNKGQPREGRISGILLRGEAISADFNREFWGIYNRIDPNFRSRDHIKEWLRGKIGLLATPGQEQSKGDSKSINARAYDGAR